MLHTELHMSSAFHPQMDGMTEQANKTVVQMLRQMVSTDQWDWVQKLLGIEFALNLAVSDSTGYSPFVMNYGRPPHSFIWDNVSEYPGVNEFTEITKHAIMATHDQIIAARVGQTFHANSCRHGANFTMGDPVYLSTKNLRLPNTHQKIIT